MRSSIDFGTEEEPIIGEALFKQLMEVEVEDDVESTGDRNINTIGQFRGEDLKKQIQGLNTKDNEECLINTRAGF